MNYIDLAIFAVSGMLSMVCTLLFCVSHQDVFAMIGCVSLTVASIWFLVFIVRTVIDLVSELKGKQNECTKRKTNGRGLY